MCIAENVSNLASLKALCQYNKRHSVTKFNITALMEQVHVEEQKFNHMTVYAATHMYVTRSSLCSCHSRPLRSYIPPCTIVDTCKRCLHGYCYKAIRPQGGQSYSVWHSLQSEVWAHSRARTVAFSMKAKYLKIRTLYRDSMPLTIQHYL